MRKHRLPLGSVGAFVLAIGIALSAWGQAASTNEWIWSGGSNTLPACSFGPPYCGQTGVYGTLQTFAAGNMLGSRTAPVTWTDNKGNLWLFGGWGYDGSGNSSFLYDLWEFDPSLNEWAWMSGSNTVGKYGLVY
jgi:hypothetical protein